MVRLFYSLLLGVGASTGRRVFFVSPDAAIGSDQAVGDDVRRPLATLGACAARLRAGDECRLLAGVYKSSGGQSTRIQGLRGTAARPIKTSFAGRTGSTRSGSTWRAGAT